MYCIKCGAELAEHEKKCPLCQTPVVNPEFIHPDAHTPYPPYTEPLGEMNRHGILFVLTFIFLVPILLTTLCDLSLNREIVWSGYTVGALALGYLVVVLPLWFKSPNPVIFVPADFIGVAAFLFYINYAVGGGWYFTFALPVTGMLAVIATAVTVLTKYLEPGILYILGGASILLGGALVGTEILLNYTFHPDKTLVWSVYPLAVFVLVGIMLIVVAVCPPLKESLKRKFFM